MVQDSQSDQQPTQLVPSEEVLALHEQHRFYSSFEAFLPDAPGLLAQSALVNDCLKLTRVLGLLEPLTGEHIPPEALQIQAPNWRESLVAHRMVSRNRAMLWLLQHLYSSLEALRRQDIYLVEALSGFALWLRRQLGDKRLMCSEYLTDSGVCNDGIAHQDLCALTFASGSFDLVLCNELFEHVPHLEQAFGEIARVLRPDGRLLATCPLAFGQQDSVVKAVADPETGEPQLLCDPEWHGDPVRPEKGSLVYRIPGWVVLEQLRAAGFDQARIHHISSWKHGILGSDLPGVLVIEAQR